MGVGVAAGEAVGDAHGGGFGQDSDEAVGRGLGGLDFVLFCFYFVVAFLLPLSLFSPRGLVKSSPSRLNKPVNLSLSRSRRNRQNALQTIRPLHSHSAGLRGKLLEHAEEVEGVGVVSV